MTTIFHTGKVPLPINAYAQAVEGGGLLHLSGQLAYDKTLDKVPSDMSVADQTEIVMANLAQVLASAGLTFADVVKSTIFLTDPADFAAVNGVYARHVGETTPPARSTIGVAFLAKGAKVEIEMVAART